ncbi:MAG TPA: extracellular solute-binding protein [Micropepsaceae bacterium]|nr:extracellular solute-binding protein [Micropepsaceae bacterium]
MKGILTAIVLAALLLPLRGAAILAAEEAKPAAAAAATAPVTLPKDIVWETDNDEPLIGSEKAIRGGTLNVAIGAYPLTFRIMGPNNNDFFASWNQAFTAGFGLVGRHPVTDKFIPIMATHWSIQKDQKTIYFKLDPDAKFSDGHTITADDYVFTWKMMQSKFIVDPFYNSYAERYYQSVDKIDDYTLRIVGTRPSWRPLVDYGGLWPTPAHATVLDKDWVTRTTNQPQIAIGPYVVSDVERGQSITFKRTPNWWGDKKRYFRGMYNFDQIHLRVIAPERELDYVRLGELDMMQESTARIWNENYTFPAVTNGWLRRARVFVDWPSGISGLHMNLESPIFQNKEFRIALQYLLNFERLNRNLMYNEYFRLKSFFEGTEYANPNLKSYEFSSEKAREHLERAGYHRPDNIRNQSTLAKLRNVAYGLLFTRSDTDDILVNDKGEKASFTLMYSAKGLEPHLTVVQQDFRRAGIDMKLQLLEPGTMFERALERKFEMVNLGMTSGLYPEPRQYLGTEFKKAKNNNDFWGFGTPEVDALIKTYEESLDADARRDAMWKIDQIVHDEAFYIPFWTSPYMRLVFWDYVQFPEFYLPRRTQQLTDWMVYWIDPAKKAALEEAKRTNKAYPVDPDLDKDYYGIRKRFQ